MGNNVPTQNSVDEIGKITQENICRTVFSTVHAATKAEQTYGTHFCSDLDLWIIITWERNKSSG